VRRALLALAFSLATVLPVRAETDRFEWKRVDVATTLDNDGRAEVMETYEVALSGHVTLIYRSLNTGPDQRTRVQAVFRRDSRGAQTPLIARELNQPDSYHAYHWGVAFTVGSEGGPPLEEQTRLYVIRYSLENAIAPAWDLPSGPAPLDDDILPMSPVDRARGILSEWMRLWPDRDRKYRFDHDVVFPTRDTMTALPELNYRFEYGTAWSLDDASRDIGVATPEIDYRVQRVLRYLPEGPPAAVDPRNAASRLFSLAGPLVLGLVLGLIFLLVDRWLRFPPRGSVDLFERHIGSQPPELVEARMGRGALPFSFEVAILRMVARKKLGVTVEPPAGPGKGRIPTVRLSVGRSGLNAFEERLVERLFRSADSVTSDEIKARYPAHQFDPGGMVYQALKDVAPVSAPVVRPLWATLQIGLGGPGLWLMLQSLLDHTMSDPIPMVAAMAPGGFVVGLWPRGTRSRPAGALVILLAVVVLGLLAAALVLTPNAPLASTASLGFGLLSLSHVAGYLARVPRPSGEDLAFAAARRWALGQLRRARPALRDSWVEAIQAMGGGSALAQWKKRAQEGGFREEETTDFTSAAAVEGLAFTGERPSPPALPEGWALAFRGR